jgi:hypothetical protein
MGDQEAVRSLTIRGKVIRDLFPLGRPRKTPVVSRVDGHHILLGQTCSTVCSLGTPPPVAKAPAHGAQPSAGESAGFRKQKPLPHRAFAGISRAWYGFWEESKRIIRSVF